MQFARITCFHILRFIRPIFIKIAYLITVLYSALAIFYLFTDAINAIVCLLLSFVVGVVRFYYDQILAKIAPPGTVVITEI